MLVRVCVRVRVCVFVGVGVGVWVGGSVWVCWSRTATTGSRDIARNSGAPDSLIKTPPELL